MGVFDSVAMIYLLFFLSLLGWFSEFLIYLAGEIIFPINQPFYYDLVDLFTIFVDFIRSSYFVLIFTVVAVNLIANALSTLDPLHFGIYALVTFTIIWVFHFLIVPEVVSMFTGLDIPGTSTDWWILLQENWYYAAISSIVGVIIGYAKGGLVKRERVYF